MNNEIELRMVFLVSETERIGDAMRRVPCDALHAITNNHTFSFGWKYNQTHLDNYNNNIKLETELDPLSDEFYELLQKYPEFKSTKRYQDHLTWRKDHFQKKF